MTVTNELTYAEAWAAEHPDEDPVATMEVWRTEDDSIEIDIVEHTPGGLRYERHLWLRDEVEAQELHDRLQDLLGTIGCVLLGDS